MPEKSRVFADRPVAPTALGNPCHITGLACVKCLGARSTAFLDISDILPPMGKLRVVLGVSLAGLALLLTSPTAVEGQSGQKRPDAPQLAPYVPTPQEVVDRMLRLGQVGKGDVVYDLGCG